MQQVSPSSRFNLVRFFFLIVGMLALIGAFLLFYPMLEMHQVLHAPPSDGKQIMPSKSMN